jgi:signal transduction histidine kinase/ligand-binding sensor domain-containing protein
MLLALFWALLFVSRAPAASLENDYLVASFTTEDGLPQNSITSIYQTPDGYLWMATYEGLARFDGARFAVFNSANTPAISSSGMSQLQMTSDGALWIMDDMWQVARWDGDRFQRMTGTNGLPEGKFEFLGESPEGKILFGRLKGEEHYLYEKGVFRPSPFPATPLNTLDVHVDSRWNLWTRDAAEWVRRPFRELVTMLPNTVPGERVRAAKKTRDGPTWIITTWQFFWTENGKIIKAQRTPEEIASVTVSLEDHLGNIWLGTWAQGLWRISPNGEFVRYPVTRGRLPEAVRSLCEDREGNIWVGTDASGVLRLRPRIFRTYDVESGLTGGDFLRSMTRDSKDNIWVVNQSGVDRIGPMGPLHIPDIKLAWASHCDSRDRVWIGCYGGEIYKIESGKCEPITVNTNSKPETIYSILEHDGAVLLGSANGLWEIRDGAPKRREGPPGSSVWPVRALLREKSGALLMGTDGGGLWRLASGNWSRVEARNFDEDMVRVLYGDDDGTIWIGSHERGLIRVSRGEAFRFDAPKANLPLLITAVTSDGLGNLWLGTRRGITRVSKAQLSDFAAGRLAEVSPVTFTKSDGLKTLECSGERSEMTGQTSDGRLWFATVKGVSVVDPRLVPRNAVMPPVVIEQARIFGRESEKRGTPTEVDRPRVITAPSGTHRLELAYTALSFTAPERVRFRYRLEGLEKDWTEAGSRRIAHYQGLPPGDYKFHVIACNNDGLWNETGAMATLIVEPHFTETFVFRFAVAALIAVSAWVAYRNRMAQLRSVTDLRLRIARDLHDEIGANLGSIGLNTEMLINDPAASQEQRQDLSEIRAVASQTAQAVRDIVWFTNPEFDNTHGMARRMREVATLLMAGRECVFEVAGAGSTALPLSIEFRRNVFSIFKETLHNIVKHSQATKVKIEIALDGDGMEMIIADNGRGFDAERLSGGGNGLMNLRRRAAEIGGTLDIFSSVEAGTRITLKAPYRQRRGFKNWFTNSRD